MQIYLIIALVFAIVAVGFTVQNNEPVTIHLFNYSYQTGIAWVAIISVFIGALLMWLASALSMILRRKEPNKVKNKEVVSYREEIQNHEKKLEVIQGEIVNLKAEIQKINTKLQEQKEKTPENEITQVEEYPSHVTEENQNNQDEDRDKV